MGQAGWGLCVDVGTPSPPENTWVYTADTFYTFQPTFLPLFLSDSDNRSSLLSKQVMRILTDQFVAPALDDFSRNSGHVRPLVGARIIKENVAARR